MENEQIAELLAKKVYRSNNSDINFAIQLFVEKIVLPTGVNGYTKDDLKRYILLSLEKKDQAIEWQKHIDSSRKHESEEV